MLPQRLPGVFSAEQSASTQQRHQLGDEHFQHRRQHRRHQVKSVAGAIVEPVLEQIGDLLRRSRRDEMSPCAGHIAQQLTQGRLLAANEADDHLGAAACRLDLGGIGEILGRERCVQRQMGKVMPAEAAGQTLASHFRVGQVIQFAGDTMRLGLGAADHRAQAGQDQHLAGVAPLRAASRFRSA